MSGGGGGGGGSQIVGYKYHLGVMLAVCHGPADAVTGFICGERTAWEGTQSVSGEIVINQPDLFGGDKREGGLVGKMQILMGNSNQARDGYLSRQQGVNCPAYRRIVTVLFKPLQEFVTNWTEETTYVDGEAIKTGVFKTVAGKAFMWSSGNPYFKAPWIRVRRILSGWNTPVFDSGRARIDSDGNGLSYDMNAAHIVYQCFTDPEWGMGYSPDDIDTASFLASSQKLYDEKFGLSIEWKDQSQIKDFVQEVINHVNGSIRLNLSTGKLMFKLIRDDYDVATLTSLNESNVKTLKSFERAAYGDFANELVVTYTSRDGEPKTIAVQDLASIQAQGSVISTSKNYPGIRNAELAARVALRDLALVSTPLSKLSLVTNRILWDKEAGDVVKFSWAGDGLGLIDVPYRIVAIDKGNLRNGEIVVDLVEDVFGLPDGTYTQLQSPLWTDTTKYPQNIEAGRAIEVPYWEVVRRLSAADMAYLEPQYGFGILLAARGVTNTPFNYVLRQSSSPSGPYATASTSNFNPTGLLASTVTAVQTTFTIESFYDLTRAVFDANNGYAIVDDEFMAVVGINVETGVVTVRRGVLDTVPKPHNIGTRIFFIVNDGGIDTTHRTAGESTYYKALPVTGLGTLDETSASTFSVTFNNRASRPYPPGNLQIGGSYFPASLSGSISASWAHRDRIQQTASLIDFTQGNIGPEAGTTYNVYVYSGATLKRSYTGLTGTSWSYPAADEAADGYVRDLRLVVNSQVAGVTSLQQHDHTVTRYGMGFSLGQSLGGIAI